MMDMKQEDSCDFDKDFLSYDDIERIVRRARMERDAAIGRAIRSVVLSVAKGYGRLTRAIETALRLRALAMLDDRQLMALGLDRQNLPAYVYGWNPVAPGVAARDLETDPVRLDRIAA